MFVLVAYYTVCQRTRGTQKKVSYSHSYELAVNGARGTPGNIYLQTHTYQLKSKWIERLCRSYLLQCFSGFFLPLAHHILDDTYAEQLKKKKLLEENGAKYKDSTDGHSAASTSNAQSKLVL